MFNFVFTLLFVCLDKMKDAIIAKLANQAADFYGDAFKQCQYKENLPKVRALALTRTHARMHAHSIIHPSSLSDIGLGSAVRYGHFLIFPDIGHFMSRLRYTSRFSIST